MSVFLVGSEVKCHLINTNMFYCRQLVEQGKVKLDDPVEDILPEIKEIKMLDGSEPKNKITLRMLVSCLH